MSIMKGEITNYKFQVEDLGKLKLYADHSSSKNWKERNLNIFYDRYVNNVTYRELGEKYNLCSQRIVTVVMIGIRQIKAIDRFRKNIDNKIPETYKSAMDKRLKIFGK